MSTKQKLRIVVYSIIICGGILFIYGRSLWHPVYVTFTGKRSLADVYEEVGVNAEATLTKLFKDSGVLYPSSEVTLIAIKEEQLLEVWAKHNSLNVYITSYPFTAYSGKLGPKLASGDMQIPEGLYGIEYLNPNSSFHLSMKIDYPNEFDIQKANEDGRTNLGGDIFIHGKLVTIGCIPIGDDNIEELFTLVYRTGIERIHVIMTPYDMRKETRDISASAPKWLSEKYDKIKTKLNYYKL